MKTKYNKTQLNPDNEFERHVFHRDQFAHYFRWSHVLKLAMKGKKDLKILDFGCGSGNLAEVFYRNRVAPKEYLGLDIRKQTIDGCKIKFGKLPWARFETEDLVEGNFNYGNDWDIICCFEVIEHIGKHNADKFLANIQKHCGPNTLILLSTPNYDERVGAADNHMIEGQVGEFEYYELINILHKYFDHEVQHGTFASQKDVEPLIEGTPIEPYYRKLKEFYDVNIVACLLAPLYPTHSRNILYKMRLKGQLYNNFGEPHEA